MPLANIVALAFVSKFHQEILRKYLPKLELLQDPSHRGRYHVGKDGLRVRKTLPTGISHRQITHSQRDPSKDVKINSNTRIPDICIQLLKRGLADGGAYLRFVDDLLEYFINYDLFFGNNIKLAYTRNGGLCYELYQQLVKAQFRAPSPFRVGGRRRFVQCFAIVTSKRSVVSSEATPQ